MYLSTSLSSHLSSPLPLRHQKLDVISFLKMNSWLWLPSGCSTQWLILVLMWKDLSSSSKMEELSTTWMSSCTLPSCCYHIPNPFRLWPLRWNHHSHLFDLPNRGLDRLQYVQDSPARVHTWQHIIPTWISNKILLTYKSLYAITPGTFQTFSAKRLLSFWVLGAVARTLWKHTPLSALKCLDRIFKKQLIKNCHVLTEAFDLGSLKCAI